MKEGRTVEEMKRAIDSFVLDEWDGRGKYMDIVYCIGKQRGGADNLDKWVNVPLQEKVKEGGFLK